MQRGEKVGVLNVRLFRPFSVPHFRGGPASTRTASPCWIAPKSRALGVTTLPGHGDRPSEARAEGLSICAEPR